MQFNNSALLYREAKELQRQGFEIDVINLRSSKRESIFRSFDGINIYGIQARPYAEKKAIIYFIKLLSFYLKTSIILTFSSVTKRYRLIHVTAPPDFMVFTTLVPRLLGAKIVLDIHDISPELFMEKLHILENTTIIKALKHIEKIATKFAHHVITVTDLWREKLISRSVPSNKCTVLLNVPDENLFKPFKDSQKPSNGLHLYYHGSLEEYFGVDTLLKAMPIIKQSIPHAKLFIYGGGRLKDSFLKSIEEMGDDDSIKIQDKVPFYELPSILGDADIGIVPTKNSNFSDDTISMKSLEYMALGIPIVISSTKAHRFYFDDAIVKFFEPENKVELARGVISLYDNKNERESLVKNAHSFMQLHGWQEHKKVYLNIVDRLMANG